MAQEEVGLSTGTVIGSSNQLPNIASKYSMGMGSCNTGVFESGHATVPTLEKQYVHMLLCSPYKENTSYLFVNDVQRTLSTASTYQTDRL